MKSSNLSRLLWELFFKKINQFTKLIKKILNGNRFYSFTDGLSESLDKNNEEVGIEGSKKIINNNFNSSLADELDNISKEVISNSSKDKLDDDFDNFGYWKINNIFNFAINNKS